ncbi:Biopolymer transport protein ExbB [Rosistilla oblonga]|uniref:Biopolymer transport protein ExbB n=1 Tax=Rosistilla oblonga TaxID=2527990 RepID=A0A518IYV9_9BACT|nr:MotA/TolQ/ExbB proton channel family protein [Rosistilla oblonga]QDV13531.1 Biopolymer transport protein ExbB [Rosistilla oblonga]QDV58276.1 Biopolymer transport protein ExbB [Rosistilla oblonga]
MLNSSLAMAGLLAQTVDADAGGGSFWQILFSGGIVGLLIILLLFSLSLIAAFLIFDQFMALRRAEVIPEGVVEPIQKLLAERRVKEADAICRQKPSLLTFVMMSGLAEVDFGWPSVEKAMEEALAEQSARMMRRIEYLSVIGNIAPMVGLLGTVTGMIFAFQRVAISQGGAGAGDLAEGIYQALVTTVGGLIVAIPALGAFAVLRNRVDGLVAEVAYLAQHAMSGLKRRSVKRPVPGTPIPPVQ